MQIKDLFDDMPLPEGAVVDIRLQKLLREPLDVCADWQRTENLLLEAHRLMPQQLEVLVALYKMYAYSNRFDESLQRIEDSAFRRAPCRYHRHECPRWHSCGCGVYGSRHLPKNCRRPAGGDRADLCAPRRNVFRDRWRRNHADQRASKSGPVERGFVGHWLNAV